MRETVHFDSDGSRCEAWLHRPERPAGTRAPAVVLGHGLGAVKGMRLDAYAERFAAAGYLCLVFDYRHFGGSEGEPRQLLSVPRQLGDWAAALAFVRSLPEVDPDQVAILGSSFGGGHVLTTAARDHRVAAAIAQCPFTDGPASALAIPPRTSARVMIAGLRDRVGRARGRAPVYIPGSGEPGTTAFMTANDALPGMLAISEGVPDFDNRLTARSLFDILTYRPGRRARDITCPLFVAICAEDTVAPAGVTRRHVSKAADVEIRTYPIGHFDIYVGEDFERAVGDYLRFLQVHVPVEPV